MDKKLFFDAVRSEINLTTSNVAGFDKVLDYGAKRNTGLGSMAYITATSFWETGQTMQPVREAYWKDERWRKANLRYYPWYGRGLIQTTWEDNYRTMSPIVGTDLIKNPDALLKWEYALPALFVGMERGLYTGKKLSDYIDDIDENDTEDFREYMNARRIVNAMDKAETIGKLALTFEKGLKAGNWNGKKETVAVPTIPVAQKPTNLKDLFKSWWS